MDEMQFDSLDDKGFSEIVKTTESSEKIRSLDFRYFPFLDKNEMECIEKMAYSLELSFEELFKMKYGIDAKVSYSDIKQDSFFRGCEIKSLNHPMCFFDWLGGTGMIGMDTELFLRDILKQKKQKDSDSKLNGLEKKIFTDLICSPICRMIKEKTAAQTGKEISDISKLEYYNIFSSLMHDDIYGLIVTFRITYNKQTYYLALGFDRIILDKLRKLNLFHNRYNEQVIPPYKPFKNGIIEMGRFYIPDRNLLKEDMIFITNRLAGEPLDVVRDNLIVVEADTVTINDYPGVRLLRWNKMPVKINEGYNNARLVYGSIEIPVGTIYEEGLTFITGQKGFMLFKVLMDETPVAEGEVLVIDDHYAVKIKRVLPMMVEEKLPRE